MELSITAAGEAVKVEPDRKVHQRPNTASTAKTGLPSIVIPYRQIRLKRAANCGTRCNCLCWFGPADKELVITDNLQMNPKEQHTFASELRRMTEFEVRENSKPSIQRDPIKRAIAVTELERRRQTRAPKTTKDPILGRTGSLIFLTVVIALAVAAAAYWKFF